MMATMAELREKQAARTLSIEMTIPAGWSKGAGDVMEQAFMAQAERVACAMHDLHEDVRLRTLSWTETEE